MKKILLSILTILSITNQSFAGGDIDPVEPQISVPMVSEAPAGPMGLYAGLGYSYMKMSADGTNTDTTGNAITALAGYNILDYLAVEGRYTATLGDINIDNGITDVDNDGDMTNIGLYLKPQYDIDKFTLYGLLGYGQVTVDAGTSYSENGFQWGAGANFTATDNVDVYVDYTRLYDDDEFDGLQAGDITIDAVNVGVNYKF